MFSKVINEISFNFSSKKLNLKISMIYQNTKKSRHTTINRRVNLLLPKKVNMPIGSKNLNLGIFFVDNCIH